MNKKIAPVKALLWIVLSTCFVSGVGYSAIHHGLKWQRKKGNDPHFQIVRLLQTGPQKEALKTTYLAQLMEISRDRPINIYAFDPKLAEKRLLSSPVIKEAKVKILPPNSVYVDYTVRQPIASLFDYENIAIDAEGYIFPLNPFFSPKNLPEIYLGLSPFGLPPSRPGLPVGIWHTPLMGKHLKLVYHLLSIMSEIHLREVSLIRRIDVSKAFADSYGAREIVILLEDEFLAKEAIYVKPRYLRLSTKGYEEELKNFLNLRKDLIEKERRALPPPQGRPLVRLSDEVIDFRIANLAFIQEEKNNQ